MKKKDKEKEDKKAKEKKSEEKAEKREERKDYNITKLEKGPLQRFKNQNLILKRYGEVGLKVYKAITGKRTTNQLQQDLGIKKDLFDEIIQYLQEAGMVELTPVGVEEKKEEKPPEEIPPKEEEITPPEEKIEIPPPEEELEEEEKPAKKPPAKPSPKKEEFEEEIKPIEIELPEEIKEEKEKEEETEEEEKEREEIEEKEEAEEELPEEVEEKEEIAPSEEEAIEEVQPEGEIEEKEGEELTPIEKIIKDRYGDIGLRVYELIDGQRTAEEIMNETGLSESKLIEILDFMDEQGIIKLDYPKAKEKAPPIEEKKEAGAGFGPMIEGEEAVEKPEAITIPTPVEIPVKAPMDIVKSVQMRAKLLLKYKDKGGKIWDEIDGKKDVVDMALEFDIPLYTVYEILGFMLDNGMIIIKPMTREEVRKKYGDDGYTVYKKYGREGLMLYELIGKDLTIKQMADKVTTDYKKVIDMFLFIHEVLGIELPIDRNVLAKQLGIS